jgi:hypothetical protein
MKQTAVEWLQQALEDTILTHEQIMQTVGLFEQAKEIEQEQMMQCHYDGQRIHSKSITHSMLMDNCESYWQETFNTNEK